MPSPDRHQWQVAAQAVDRGMDLTARRARQKRLFRSRSEAPTTLLAAAFGAEEPQGAGAGQQQAPADWSEGSSDLEALRVHSRVALLPADGSNMV